MRNLPKVLCRGDDARSKELNKCLRNASSMPYQLCQHATLEITLDNNSCSMKHKT